MTRKITTRAEFAVAEHLQGLGVFFDEGEFEQMRADSAGLSITQNFKLPSTVLDTPGGAGYVLNALIINESSEFALWPTRITFDGPKWDAWLELLPDPRCQTPGEHRDLYVLDRKEAGYGRPSVLNHHIGRRHRLAPGESVEGFLLAVGQVAIPWAYNDRDSVDVPLTLFDQWGRSYGATFSLKIERSPVVKRMKAAAAAPSRKPRRSDTED